MQQASLITYGRCLKNHAASIGCNALDGCGEFMPGGSSGTLEALMCAACSCHRNFHQKEEHHGEAMMVHPLNQHWGAIVPVALGRGMESSGEELPATKKRHRTKFTAEQKEMMVVFADKVGWKIPKEKDAELKGFCGEVGVNRQVFKVWMHNNKKTHKKPPPQQEEDQM